MKRKNLFSMMVMMMTVMLSVGFASCSSDDDDIPSLDTPKYESVSARYDVTAAGSEIKSIELTASGNYIIIRNGSYAARDKAAVANAKKPNFLQRAAVGSRETDGWGNDIIYGKFTQISDTEFMLEGYGKIVIEGSAEDALSIVVTPNSGKVFTVPVSKHTQNPSGTLTNQLCRTWDFTALRIIEKANGRTIFDKKVDRKDWNQYKDFIYTGDYDDDDYWYNEVLADYVYDYEDGFPQQCIFTKSGTYMVTYSKGTMEVSTWTWENEPKGILRYSWDYDNMYDERESGTVNVGFEDGQLTIAEEYEEEDDGVVYSFSSIWYMSEAK